MKWKGDRCWSVRVRIRSNTGNCLKRHFYQEGIKPTELDVALYVGADLQYNNWFGCHNMGIGFGEYRIEEITIEEV